MKRNHGSHDNLGQIKDLVMVTSSNVSPNDGMIRILTQFFWPKPTGLGKTHKSILSFIMSF